MDHHPTLSPSSFPALMKCSCFVPGGNGKSSDASKGTLMHEYCALLAAGGPAYNVPGLDKSDQENCEFIVSESLKIIKEQCPDAPIEIEKEVTLFDDDLNVVTFGTRDIGTHNKEFAVILDFKGALDFDAEGKNYRDQLAVYALCDMRKYGLKKALCMEGYISPRKIYPYWIDYDTAAAIVESVVRAQSNPEKTPIPNTYCKWCSSLLSCSAINNQIAMVDKAFSTIPAPEKLLNPELITDPAEMSQALIFAGQTMSQYIKRLTQVVDAIDAAAMAMSDAGTAIPDFKRIEKEGNKKIRDPQKAFDAVGLPAEDFYKAVSVSLPKLAEAYGDKNGLSVKEARKTVEKLAAAAIGLEKPKKSLEWMLK